MCRLLQSSRDQQSYLPAIMFRAHSVDAKIASIITQTQNERKDGKQQSTQREGALPCTTLLPSCKARQGQARPGKAGQGKASQGTWHGMAWHGQARPGQPWHGTARHDCVRPCTTLYLALLCTTLHYLVPCTTLSLALLCTTLHHLESCTTVY